MSCHLSASEDPFDVCANVCFLWYLGSFPYCSRDVIISLGRFSLRILFLSSTVVAPRCHTATMDDGTTELDLLDSIVTIHEPLDLGNFRHVPGWNGKCIGDCIATISDKVLRVVAFQAAGCIGEA